MAKFADEWGCDMGGLSERDLVDYFKNAEEVVRTYSTRKKELEEELKDAEETAMMCAREFIQRHVDDL